MPTTPRRKPKRQPLPADYHSYQLHQHPIDLFGEIVITDDDLYDWVAAVAPLHLSQRAYANYVRSYDVAGKVRTAKLAGRFATVIANPRQPWHARLALHAIL